MFRERLQIRLNRAVRRWQALRHLVRVDGHPMPEWKPDEVWMMVVCRNEALRIPFMLDYHFRLGVSRVLLIDNASTDGTPDLVRDDSRIHVFSSSETYRGPLYWQEPLLRRYARGRWCLVLDADELFAYPDMDTLSLPDLVRRLNAEGAQALHTVFVEMFSQSPISAVHYVQGGDLREAAPFFDPAGFYVKKAYRRVFSGPGSDFIYMGGTRGRVFGEEFGCSKVPLFRYSPEMFLRRGLHTIEGARVSGHQAAVLHFKYLQDFHEKVVRETARNVYWNGAAEYKAYAALLEKNPDFTLWHPGARRYESWRSLADAGLVF
jgi:glycosyltransferase involved in cell wall biosynthesis